MNYLTNDQILSVTELNKSKALFRDVIEANTGYLIIKEDKSNFRHRLIYNKLNEACLRLIGKSVRAGVDKRINGSSLALEKVLASELKKIGCIILGRSIAGYPDITFAINGDNSNTICYVEVKSTGKKDPEDEKRRGFYASGELKKIVDDGLHFSVAFKVTPITEVSDQFDSFNMIRKEGRFIINKYIIMDLYNFEVDLKCEWNAPTQELYGKRQNQLCRTTIF